MKIYNKVIINMSTWEIKEEDSFEYENEVALAGGGDTTVHAPQPTAEERALQAEQLKMLQTQRAETEQMRPYVLKGMGLVEEDDELRYMTEEERLAGMSEMQRAQYELTRTSQERQAQAYAGELPISPALEESLTQQQAQMGEALSQRLGPNWMLTTSGQQAMSGFTQKADLLREEARRGAITGEGGLLLSNLGYLGNVRGARTAEAANYPSRTSGLFQGYGVLQAPYRHQRGMQHQANIASAQASAQQQAGMWGGIGQLAGSAIGAYGMYAGLAAASSETLKKNIKTTTSPIEKIKAVRGVDFDWKTDAQDYGKGHDIGVVAEELEKVIPEAVIEVDGIKHVFYHKIIPVLIEAVKAQQLQINSLREANYAQYSNR